MARTGTRVVPIRASPMRLPGVRSVISRALAEDPLVVCLFPKDEFVSETDRLNAIAAFYAPSVERAAFAGDVGTAVYEGHIVGAAVWGRSRYSSPWGSGGVPEDEVVPTSPSLAAVLLGDRADEFAAELSAARVSAPEVEGDCLVDLAVDPAHQGQGIGSRLLAETLATRFGRTAWLETTNPRNRTFYERAGFVVTHEAEIGSTGVSLRRMVRPASPALPTCSPCQS